jgi:hypothetical protein
MNRFSSTNECEGSEIAGKIVNPLLDEHVKIWFVTHVSLFARRVCGERAHDDVLFRVERRPDGTRPFKLIEGEPLQTSYGEDPYSAIFGSRYASQPGQNSNKARGETL